MKKIILISIIPLLIFSQNHAQIPSDSLIAKYPFNNNARDESGNGNNGIIFGAILTQDRFDFNNSALSFDGINDYVDIGKMNKLNSNLENFSVSFWINSDSLNKFKYETVMKTINNPPKGTVFSIEVHRGRSASFNAGVIRLDIRDEFDKYFTIYIDKPEVFDNYWHNVIFVVDSTSENKGAVFVDGSFIEKDSTFGAQGPAIFEPFEHSLTIGAANNRGQIETYFKGILDDIRFYNKSLDSGEINDLYYEGYCHEVIYDTINVALCDSVLYDTIVVYDTIHVDICDSISYDTVYFYDTIQITIYDTISVSDTLIVDLEIVGDNPPGNSVIIKVFPNPAFEKIYIYTSDYSLTEEYKVKIINNLGTLIFESFLNDQLMEIDMSQFGGPGIYYMQILNSKSEIIEVRKILLTN
jgi:hypothetical protein